MLYVCMYVLVCMYVHFGLLKLYIIVPSIYILVKDQRLIPERKGGRGVVRGVFPLSERQKAKFFLMLF